MIAAVVLVAAGAVPGGEIATAIYFPTLLLMGGLMILSARVGAAGFMMRPRRGSRAKRGGRLGCWR